MVLKKLKDEYGINQVSLDLFYTYVMTCKDFNEIDEAIFFIRNNSPISEYISKYKDRSRIRSLFNGNIALFVVDKNYIKLNEKLEEYFQSNFIEKIDLDELKSQLKRDIDYSYFLYNNQNFNVNLIDLNNYDNIKDMKILNDEKNINTITPKLNIEDDQTYVEKVNNVSTFNINENAAKEAFKVEPFTVINKKVKKYRKNPMVGKIAIKKANYECEFNSEHFTFISSRTKETFMEAHHLIPMNQLENIWNKFKINIDCVENIVSLCPNCHRAIHYGTKEEKITMLRKLFELKHSQYKKIGITLTIEDLYKMYSV